MTESRESRLARLAQRARTHLEGNLLPFWLKLEDRVHGAHYASMPHDRVDTEAPKGTIFVGRVLWTMAEAHRVLEFPECLAQAGRAQRFLLDHLLDPTAGGFYWSVARNGRPLERDKQLYAQNFGIYGLAAYARVADGAEARGAALAVYRTVKAHCLRDHGLYQEGFNEDWTPGPNRIGGRRSVPGPYTANTHIHLIEALSELLAATGDASVRASLADLLTAFVARFVGPSGTIYPLLDEAQRPLSRSVQPGHDIEASWLIDLAADRIGDPAVSQRMRKTASRLARTAMTLGQHPDGGWVDNLDMEGESPSPRMWWMQAEGLLGLANEALRSAEGHEMMIERAEACWNYIDRHVIDHENGDWFTAVDADGSPDFSQPKVGFWKEAYHQARMCLQLIEWARRQPG